jgi:hypothetical protein
MDHVSGDRQIRGFTRDELQEFFSDNQGSLLEAEALAVLDNPFVTPRICQAVVRSRHLAAFYSVRLRLVQNRRTPLADSVKLVHYLHWPDLLRLSVDVRMPPQVRHAIETRLLLHLDTLSLGEQIAAAKRGSSLLCSSTPGCGRRTFCSWLGPRAPPRKSCSSWPGTGNGRSATPSAGRWS